MSGSASVDVRFDFLVDRRYDVGRKQVVDDDSTVRQKSAYDSLGTCIGLNMLELDVVHWCHGVPLLAAVSLSRRHDHRAAG